MADVVMIPAGTLDDAELGQAGDADLLRQRAALGARSAATSSASPKMPGPG